MFIKETYQQRRAKIHATMKSGLALFLGNQESPINYPGNTYHFRQDSNFIYFFGLNLPNLAAVMDFDKETDTLFGDDIDIEDIIWMGPQASLKSQAEKAGIEHAEPLARLETVLHEAMAKGRKIHFVPQYRAENKILISELLGIKARFVQAYTSTELIKAIVPVRSVKTLEEIAEIEKACAVGYKMHTMAMKMARKGVKESEIAGFIDGISFQYGTGTSFPTILSQNGEILHNHGHKNTLEAGKLLLVDAGAEIESGYCSDNTRTTPVSGRFTQKQKEIYQIVLNANNTAREATVPGRKYQEVHLIAAKVIASGLKELGLMTGDIDDAVREGAHALFFPHGLGHHIGLDVHDMENLGENYVGYDAETQRINQFGTAYLRMGKRLEVGHVVTNEPGIYFIPALIDLWQGEKKFTDFINYDKLREYRDFGGIRLEDDILVTETGCRILGERIPIEVEEVENFMKG